MTNDRPNEQLRAIISELQDKLDRMTANDQAHASMAREAITQHIADQEALDGLNILRDSLLHANRERDKAQADHEVLSKRFETSMIEYDRKIESALEVAVRHGGADGSDHKAWVIDQMVRLLAGARYEKLVRDAKDGEDGPDTYGWDEGIAP